MDNFMTSPIKVESGVLQGDSLSPLIFKLIVNTLINTANFEKVECRDMYTKVTCQHQNISFNLQMIPP